MRTIDIIKRAGRNLNQAKLRTILTALAISIGAFVIMTSLAFGVGVNNYTDSLIGTNISERSLSVSKKAVSVTIGMQQRGGLRKYSENYNDAYRTEFLDDADAEKVKKVAEVEKLIPYQMVNMKYFVVEGNPTKWSSSIGTFDSLIKNEAVAGKLPETGGEIGEGEIIVPEGFLKDLKLTASEIVGKDITLTFSIPMNEDNLRDLKIDLSNPTPELRQQLEKGLERDYQFKVAAVSKEMPMAMNTSQLMINEKIHHKIGNDISRGTENYGKYLSLVAILKDGVKPEDGKKQIEEQTDLKAMTARELQQLVSQFTNILQIIVVSFGVLSLVVSVFGIINTLYVSVLERTSQIGLMKALGMRGKHVAKLFRYEAAWVGFIGGSVGVGLSWIIGNAMNPWISQKIGFKPEDAIYLLKYKPSQALILIGALVVIAIVSGFLPARKAAKLDPIEALRTE